MPPNACTSPPNDCPIDTIYQRMHYQATHKTTAGIPHQHNHHPKPSKEHPNIRIALFVIVKRNITFHILVIDILLVCLTTSRQYKLTILFTKRQLGSLDKEFLCHRLHIRFFLTLDQRLGTIHKTLTQRLVLFKHLFQYRMIHRSQMIHKHLAFRTPLVFLHHIQRYRQLGLQISLLEDQNDPCCHLVPNHST